MFTRLLVVIFVLWAGSALAQTDSVSTALKIVNDYHTESEAITIAHVGPAHAATLTRSSLEGKEEARKRLRELRWTDAPGMRRFRHAYSIVESYTSGHISAVMELVSKLSDKEKSRAEEVVSKLSSLKRAKLQILDSTVGPKTFRKKPRKAVPIVDRSPFDEPPPENPGIWYR